MASVNTGQARLLVGLYLDLSAPGNAEVVALAVELLGIAALYQVVDGIQVANNGALQGLKDTRVPMGIDLLTFWGIGKSSGELAHMERFFGRLRQKLARYVRRMRAASESERTGHLTTKLFVEWYNETVT